MSTNSFVHLRVHTEFSLKDSIVRVKPLLAKTKSLGMFSIGVSDSTNMFAAIRFYQYAMSNGIKPIISSEINLLFGDRPNTENSGVFTLICKNNDGYFNLVKLISRAYEEGQLEGVDYPVVKREWLSKENTNGLIMLSGGRDSLIGNLVLKNKGNTASHFLTDLNELFKDNFYLELQRTGHQNDDKYVSTCVYFAQNYRIPVVATNNVRFLERSDFEAHENRVAISEGITTAEYRQTHHDKYSDEQYLKSPEEMREIFSDIPSALENTVKIALQCSVDLTLGKSFLPEFKTPNSETEADFLVTSSRIGLDARLKYLYGEKITEEQIAIYKDRLEFELNVINNMGFAGYFLIVADFIQWSKDNDIPVGAGRGSGAGSLVAYSLKITDLDPLEYDLLFERFLNPERVSMPDFDIDFCMDRRDEVIKYVSDKYGHKAVAQIVTFGTMAAKGAIRDVAKAMGYPYSLANRISMMIPSMPAGIKISEALESEAHFKLAYDTDTDIRSIVDAALKLEGITRQTGKHAGGVLISKGDLTNFTPTYNLPDGSGFVSQYDKNDVETAGLVKFDFLGLQTLTIINDTVKDVNEKRKKEGAEPIDILKIPLDDKEVFKILQNGDTSAVFQVESNGMKDLLKRLKPDRFEDLIALVALFRPGPLQSGMVDNFIDRKHGRETISYPDSTYQHESLKGILEPTYGIILYQEQVMQIAQVLSGYSLGQADLLRRAMGKKKPEEMAKQRQGFCDGAYNNSVDRDLAGKIFDIVEKFAGYGFNKSHSAAYALISYQTAWLKTHYPVEFMSAVLSGCMDDTTKIVKYIFESQRMGIKIAPPDVNKSGKRFVSDTKNKAIIYGMGAIKNIGDSVLYPIIEERKNNGVFKSIFDLASRVKMNIRNYESAVKSGLFDCFSKNRNSLMKTIPVAIDLGKQIKSSSNSMQDDLFGNVVEDEAINQLIPAEEWTDNERLAGERDKLGLYLTGHPLDQYEAEIKNIISDKVGDVIGPYLVDSYSEEESETEEQWKDKVVEICGLIVFSELKNNAKNQQSAVLKIDDKSAQIDVVVYNNTLHDCQQFLVNDTTVYIKGKIRRDAKTKKFKMIAYEVQSIDLLREKKASYIAVNLKKSEIDPVKLEKFKKLVTSQDYGNCPIKVNLDDGGDIKTITLGDHQIQATNAFLDEATKIFGKGIVEVVYLTGKNTNAAIKRTKAESEEHIALGQRTKDDRYKRIGSLLEQAREAMLGGQTL